MRIKETKAPEITYVTLSSPNAIILDAAPVWCERDTIKILIRDNTDAEGVLEDAYMVVVCGDITTYRSIINGAAELNLKKLDGKVRLSVVSKNSKKIWKCEMLEIISLGENKCLVLPFERDTLAKISSIMLELDSVKQRISANEEKISTFDGRLDEIMGNYDLI